MYILQDKGKKNICYKNFNETERKNSSTWRELEAIHYSLKLSKEKFKNKAVLWYTDNYACISITNNGSNKEVLQELALKSFGITFECNIDLSVRWISRDDNQQADSLSRNID